MKGPFNCLINENPFNLDFRNMKKGQKTEENEQTLESLV